MFWKGSTFILICLLLYSRLVNVDWGLPYPMHPDERNMAVAIQQLHCDVLRVASFDFQDCLNPHFFAYGQFPLYIAYGGIQLFHTLFGITGPPTFVEATVALRVISAISSVLLVFVLLKIVSLLYKPHHKLYDVTTVRLFALCVLIFQPYAIQFAHFGTTESLLMLFFSISVYCSLRMLQATKHTLPVLVVGIVLGLALGTKTSSLLFLILPTIILMYKRRWWDIPLLICIVIAFTLLSSPQSFIHWNDFKSSMDYESAVGLGTYKAFYTRQFENTTPIMFQLTHILPYALGLPTMIAGMAGLLLLSWKKKEYVVLRIAFIIAFLPSAFFYAKWTRFIAPALPILTVIGIVWFFHLLQRFGAHKIGYLKLMTVVCLMCIHGVAYLSVYTNQDVRFTASEWIYRNVPENSSLLSETANVVDIPIPPPEYNKPVPNYLVMSFNFYDLDSNQDLRSTLKSALEEADYILVPSRRIFKNHPPHTFPLVAQYYEDLISGRSGFTQIGEISSYPKISLFGKTIWEWRDEDAEETWTVFDHPVIRIYKKITNLKSPITNQSQISNYKFDFSKYKTIDFRLSDIETYRLLVADTPEKWEQGLMYVRTKDDISGYDGMLFQFPNAEQRMFWNKNTLSDLTLYWMHNGKVIGTSSLPSIEKTGSITSVFSPSPADQVVELLIGI